MSGLDKSMLRAYVRTRKLGISPPRTSLKNSVNSQRTARLA